MPRPQPNDPYPERRAPLYVRSGIPALVIRTAYQAYTPTDRQSSEIRGTRGWREYGGPVGRLHVELSLG